MTSEYYDKLRPDAIYTDSNMITNFVLVIEGNTMKKANVALQNKSNPGDETTAAPPKMYYPKLTPEQSVSLDF